MGEADDGQAGVRIRDHYGHGGREGERIAAGAGGILHPEAKAGLVVGAAVCRDEDQLAGFYVRPAHLKAVALGQLGGGDGAAVKAQAALPAGWQGFDEDGDQPLAPAGVDVVVAEVIHLEDQGAVVRHRQRQGQGGGHGVGPHRHGVGGAEIAIGVGDLVQHLEAEAGPGAAGDPGHRGEAQIAQIVHADDVIVEDRIPIESQDAQGRVGPAQDTQATELPCPAVRVVLVAEGKVGRAEDMAVPGGDDHRGIGADRIILAALYRHGKEQGV